MKKTIIIFVLTLIYVTGFSKSSLDSVYIYTWFDRTVKSVEITDTITGNSVLINRKSQWPSENLLIIDTSSVFLKLSIKGRFLRKDTVIYLSIKKSNQHLYNLENRYLAIKIKKLKVIEYYFTFRIRKRI